MIFVGIDPGKQGSIAYLVNSSIKVIATPIVEKEYDIVAMKNILLDINKNDEVFCVLERAQPMPKQGVVSMFSFGKGYGIWLALLVSLGLKFQIVHSRTWTRKMLEGSPGVGKERAFNVARNLFPSWQPKFKKEYQYADAILLAEYARRIYKNE